MTSACSAETMVELVDGRFVTRDSIAWRDECLARYFLRLPHDERTARLADWRQHHGEQSAEQLIATMRALHEERRLTAT